MRSSLPGLAHRRTVRALAALAIAPLLVALAGCGSSSSTASSSASATSDSASAASGAVSYPVTVKADNGEVTIPARPKSIVSLGPSLTEMLFQIGAGSQVTAVDDQSNFPANAPKTKLSAFQPNAEAIAGYQPDLVVLSNDSGGLVAALGKLKVPVLLLGAPATIAGSYPEELALGQATDHVAGAQQLIDTTEKAIATAVASVPRSARPLKIYHELDQTYYSVSSATFIGDLYKQFGLVNIADAAPKVAGGYPKLSAEFVVSSAPDLIVLADHNCCGQSAAAVSKRPAFDTVPAVKTGKIVVVDDDIASRWGPRLADFAKAIAHTLGAPA
jgi:cobalamin transport system substrate-binding protein